MENKAVPSNEGVFEKFKDAILYEDQRMICSWCGAEGQIESLGTTTGESAGFPCSNCQGRGYVVLGKARRDLKPLAAATGAGVVVGLLAGILLEKGIRRSR